MSARTYTTIPGLQLLRQGGAEMELFLDAGDEDRLPGFTRLFHREPYGEMDFQYFIGEGFQLWRSHYAMHKKIEGMSRAAIPVLELHFPLYGEAMSWWDGQREQQLRPAQFALDYLPYIDGRTVFAAGQACGTLDIHLDKSFLGVFAERYPGIENFLQSVDRQQRAQLLSHAVRFSSPSMEVLVRDILHYQGARDLAAMYYREHVCLLLEMVLERAQAIRHEYSRKKYLEACISVRQYIERHPTSVHTGKSLSAYTGINVSLLHKIFREYHGTTLFAFSQQLRLEHGKALLRDTGLFIHQIAFECGYPEQTNFTTAFRRRFGFTPQQYREAIAKTRAAK
jgi:AraC-like DNA-binding protein